MMIDMIMVYRRLTGRLGDRARSRLLAVVKLAGGVETFVAVSVIADAVAWPLTLIVCAFHYVSDRPPRAVAGVLMPPPDMKYCRACMGLGTIVEKGVVKTCPSCGGSGEQ